MIVSASARIVLYLNKAIEILESGELNKVIKSCSYFDIVVCISVLAAGGLAVLDTAAESKVSTVEISEDTLEICACVLVSHPDIVIGKSHTFTQADLWAAYTTWSYKGPSMGADMIDRVEEIPGLATRKGSSTLLDSSAGPETSPLN